VKLNYTYSKVQIPLQSHRKNISLEGDYRCIRWNIRKGRIRNEYIWKVEVDEYSFKKENNRLGNDEDKRQE